MIRSVLILVALGSATMAAAERNPLFAGADPDILAACGAWWIFPTGEGADRDGDRSSIFAYRSEDMRHWVRSATPVLASDTIGWIRDDGAPEHYLWAPGIIAANGRYYLYFSVGPQGPTPSRIGVAVSDRPEGPYVDSGRPLLTGDDMFEAIDPMVFRDPHGGGIFLYAGGSAGSTLRLFELNADMLSFRRVIPVVTPQAFTEGSFMHERRGIYYLSYSHGRYNGPSYSVHYATARSPAGPFVYRKAILTSDATHKGPGHHAFVRDPRTGRWLIVYHRWDRSDETVPFTGLRTIAIDRVRYDRRGLIKPIVMTDDAPPLIRAPKDDCQSRSNSLPPAGNALSGNR